MRRLFRNRQGVVGCEATPDHLTIAHIASGQRPTIQALHQVPNPGLSVSALRTLAKDLGLHNLPWTWILPHEQYQLMLVDVPDVPEEEISDALRWRVKDLISFPLEEAAVDTFLLPAEAFHGRSRMAFAVVARREQVDPVADTFGLAGLRLDSVDVADTALRNLAAMTAQAPAMALLLAADNDSVLNATYHKELCLNRAISLGTQDLSEPQTTPDDDAGNLALESQSEMRLDSLGLELQRSFDYFETQMGLGHMTELRVLADTPLDPGVYQYLSDRFGLNAGPLSLADHMNVPADATEADLAHHAVAIGGALQWLQEGG